MYSDNSSEYENPVNSRLNGYHPIASSRMQRLWLRWAAFVFYGLSWWLFVLVVNEGKADNRLRAACDVYDQGDVCNSKRECKWNNDYSDCNVKPEFKDGKALLLMICMMLCWVVMIILITWSLKEKYRQRCIVLLAPIAKQLALMFVLIYNDTVAWAVFVILVLLTLPFYGLAIKRCITMLPERRPAPPAYDGPPPPTYGDVPPPSAPPADLEKEGPWQSRGNISVRTYENENGQEIIVYHEASWWQRFRRWLGF